MTTPLVKQIGDQAAVLLNTADIIGDDCIASFAFIDTAALAESRAEAEPPPKPGEPNSMGVPRCILLPAPRLDVMVNRDSAETTVILQLALTRQLGCDPTSAAGQERIAELMATVDEIRAGFLGTMMEPEAEGEVQAFCDRVETAPAFPRGYDVDQLMTHHRFTAVLLLSFITVLELEGFPE